MRRPSIPLLFSLDSIPELRHVPDDERLNRWKSANEEVGGKWLLWIGFFVTMAVVSKVFHLNDSNAPFFSKSTLTLMCAYFSVSLIWGVVSINYLYRRSRSHLREILRIDGRCTACGYDLRGSPDQCPECGTPAKSDTRGQD